MWEVLLVSSWWLVGAISMAAGWAGGWYPILSLILVVPWGFLGFILVTKIRPFTKINHFSKTNYLFETNHRVTFHHYVLSAVLVAIWSLHAMGVLTPERGFDAVWYHLPVVKIFSQQHAMSYVPEYYQSLNPFFSDGIFLLGYNLGFMGGEKGAKIMAFGLAVTLLIVTSQLAKKILSKTWLLLFLISVSLIQVVTWQASSFYVDVAKALWELSAIWGLVTLADVLKTRKSKSAQPLSYQLMILTLLSLSGLAFGASLATKPFSVLLWPGMLISTWLVTRRLTLVIYFGVLALAVVFPSYLWVYGQTQDPVFAINLHLAKLSEIGEEARLSLYLSSRIKTIIFSPWQLLISRDYVSPLILIFSPLLAFKVTEIYKNKTLFILMIFSLNQWLVWWLIPPLSSRYALSGFICGLLLCFWAAEKFAQRNQVWRRSLQATVLITAVFLLLPRLWVTWQQLPVIFGSQSKADYLRQSFDGNIDQHLRKWHHLD